MVQVVFRNPWIRAAGLLLALCLAGLLMYLLSAVLVPLFFAFLVAYSFDPVVDKFERRGLPRMAGIMTLLGILFLVMIAVPLIGIPAFLQETQDFVNASTDGEHDPWVGKLVEVTKVRTLLTAIHWIEPGDTTSDVRQVVAAKLGAILSEFTQEKLQALASPLLGVGRTAGSTVAGILGSLSSSAVGVILFLGNFALFAFVTIYLLNDYDKIIASINTLIPPRFRPTVGRIMGKIDVQLRAFLRGQVIVCMSLGVFYAIGLTLSGTKFAIALGIFGAFASFVPYLGLALTIGPAVLLTILDYGINPHLAGVLLTFVIAQFLEGNFLTPKIVGSQVGLGPVWVILAIMVFSSALGFLGLLLAVPMAATLKVLVEEALVLYKRSAFFEGEQAVLLSTPGTGVSMAVPPDRIEPMESTRKEVSRPKAKAASRRTRPGK